MCEKERYEKEIFIYSVSIYLYIYIYLLFTVKNPETTTKTIIEVRTRNNTLKDNCLDRSKYIGWKM